jgi:hypothetical protein
MRKWAFASVALALVGLACGSSTGGSGNGGSSGSGQEGGSKDSGPSSAAACMTYATALCNQINACSKIDIQKNYGTLAACVTSEGEACTNALAAPQTGDTPADRVACGAALTTSSWTCPDFLNDLNPPAACAPKTGMLTTGSACAFGGQCQSSFCAIPGGAACGSCAAVPAAGASCAKAPDCGPGLVCAGAPAVCMAAGGTGAACDGEIPCQNGFWCVGFVPKTKTKPAVKGTCQAAVATAGSACDPTLKTGPACSTDEDLTCNSTSKTCATLSLAAPSGACGTATGQAIVCSDGSQCNAKVGADETGTCVPEVADQNPCERKVGAAPCATNERCIVTGDSGTNGNCRFDSASSCK